MIDWQSSFQHSIKSDIIIIFIIIAVIIAAIAFKLYTSDMAVRWGLPKAKRGAFFGLIHGAPGITLYIHQSALKNNPMPILIPSGIPKDHYYIINYDWRDKKYQGTLSPELFAQAYKRGYDITKYSAEQLADIFKDTIDILRTFHSTPPPAEFGPDYFTRKAKFATDQLQSELY